MIQIMVIRYYYCSLGGFAYSVKPGGGSHDPKRPISWSDHYLYEHLLINGKEFLDLYCPAFEII